MNNKPTTMKDLILHSTSKTELVSIIQDAIKAEFAGLSLHQDNSTNRLYTRKEVAEMLDISLPTLNEWTKAGTITAHRIGGSVRYKHEDVQKALQEISTIKYKRK